MMQQSTRLQYLLVTIGLLVLASVHDANAESNRPNILFIMTDQHRWDCIGANGNELIKTPNIDRLASEGANFTHFFVQAPVCVPSHVSFFTGRYPHSHQNRVNYTPLDRSEELMQSRLRNAGYATASVGKLHYYPPTVAEAKRTGFDSVEIHDATPALDRFSDYIAWREKNDPQASRPHRTLAKNIPEEKNHFRQEASPGSDTGFGIQLASVVGLPTRLCTSVFNAPEPFSDYLNSLRFGTPERRSVTGVGGVSATKACCI